MEELANRRNVTFSSQNSSTSSLDNSDLTLSLPDLPGSEAEGRAVRTKGVKKKPSPHHAFTHDKKEASAQITINAIMNKSLHQKWCRNVCPYHSLLLSCRIKAVLCLAHQHPHHRIRDTGMLFKHSVILKHC